MDGASRDASWTLTSPAGRATFDVRQGRLTALELDQHELLVADDGGGPWSWGGFVMAPWTSLIRDATFGFAGTEYRLRPDDERHAVLGLTWKLPWRREAERLVCDLAAGQDCGWPFGGTVWQQPALDDHGLELTLGLRAGDRSMPGAIGWHPWFRRHLGTGAPAHLTLPSAWRQGRGVTERPDGSWHRVPPGTQQLNDCLQTSGATRLTWPGCGSVEIDSTSPWVTVYSTSSRGICVEPVTSPAEQMIHVLQPGEEIAVRIRVTWTTA